MKEPAGVAQLIQVGNRAKRAAIFQSLDRARAQANWQYEGKRSLDEIRKARLEINHFRKSLPKESAARRSVKLTGLSELARFVLVAEEIRDQMIDSRGSPSAPPPELFFGMLTATLVSVKQQGPWPTQSKLVDALFKGQIGEVAPMRLRSNITVGELSDQVGEVVAVLRNSPLWNRKTVSYDEYSKGHEEAPEVSTNAWMEFQTLPLTPSKHDSWWVYQQWAGLFLSALFVVAVISGLGEVAATGFVLSEMTGLKILGSGMHFLAFAGSVGGVAEYSTNINQYQLTGITENAHWHNHESLQKIIDGLGYVNFLASVTTLGLEVLTSRPLRAVVSKGLKIGGLSKGLSDKVVAQIRTTNIGLLRMQETPVFAWSKFYTPWLKILGTAYSASEVVNTTLHKPYSDYRPEERARLFAFVVKSIDLFTSIKAFENTYVYAGPILRSVGKGFETNAFLEEKKKKKEKESGIAR